jgi:5-methylthioadenosine/S-adenosylhomocysteine deaminase
LSAAKQITRQWALTGRIVTMAAERDVLDRGTLYIDGDRIAAVLPADQSPPEGFADVSAINTGGTIYPGLVELHNHLSYNILPLWQVPRTYKNRDEWQNAAGYKTSVTGPMSAIALADDGTLLPAVVRYVEGKCLLAGATTSQGITLSNWSGTIHRYYKGVLRTAEIGAPPILPAAHSKIPDIDAQDWTKFEHQLHTASCFLLHLSEGVDTAARNHFLALRNAQNQWAIEPWLAGIHCTALTADDFQIMAQHQAHVAWSPLSNLLLYGRTTDIVAARNAGLLIALGSDWSPSGSKNLLGEVKVGKVVSAEFGLGLSDYDIVAMATRNPAQILKWDNFLGTLTTGKLADLLVISGVSDNPYLHLIKAREDDVILVAIGGRPRYGLAPLMANFNVNGEVLSVAGTTRIVDFDDAAGDSDVGKITLSDATRRLRAALANLGKLHAKSVAYAAAIAVREEIPRTGWRLALDEQFQNHVELRPRLAFGGEPTGPNLLAVQAGPVPLSPINLDALTVIDDADYIATLKKEQNLPPGIANAIATYFGA